MDFDPSSATPEGGNQGGFDPTSAKPEAVGFDADSATPEDGLFSRAAKFVSNLGLKKSVGLASTAVQGAIPELRGNLVDATTNLVGDITGENKAELAGAVPNLIARGLQAVKTQDPSALLKDAPAGGAAEGIARAGTGFAKGMTSLPNIGFMAATGGLAEAAPLAARAAGGTMAVQQGWQAASELPHVQAVLNDPKATTADKIVAVSGPVLGFASAGMMGFHTAIGLKGDFDSFVAGKNPIDAIDALNKAAATGDTDAIKARNDYVSWWTKTLDKDDTLRQSPQGLAQLNATYSAEEQASQMRERDFLRAKLEEATQQIKTNQIGTADTAQAVAQGAVDPTLFKRGQTPGAPVGKLAGDIPTTADLSAQARRVALQEGEPIPAKLVTEREQATPAGPSAPAATSERPPTATASPRQIAPAEYTGTQVFGSDGPQDIYRLNQDILGATKGQSVTAATLRRAGYDLPEKPTTEAVQAPKPVAPPQQDQTTATPAPSFQEGQKITYLTAGGGEATGTVTSANPTRGRVRITDDTGATLRVPVERIKPTPQPEATPAAPAAPEPATPIAQEAAQRLPSKGKKLRIGPAPDGSSDILNDIADLGGVRGPGENAGGEYDGWGEVFNKGPARLLRNSKAQAVDQLMKELGDKGYNFDTPDDFYRQVKRAIADRISLRDRMKQGEMFQGEEAPFNLSGEKGKAPEDDIFGNLDEQREQAAKQGEIDLTSPHPDDGPIEVPIELTDDPSPYGSNIGGHIDPKVLRFLATGFGGIGGAAYGFSKGQTPEEKIKMAVQFGALGAIGSYAVGKLSEGGFNGIASILRAATSKDIPNMRAASTEASNSAYRLANARVAGQVRGRALAAQVLGDKWSDPAFSKKFGAVLVQEMQEAKLKQLFDQRDAAKAIAIDPKADPKVRAQARQAIKDIDDHIPHVNPVWDMADNGGIKSQEDFHAALADNDIKGAIARHKELVQAQAEEAHTALGGKLAAVGPNTGAFINTEALFPDETDGAAAATAKAATPSDTGATKGNLRNPRVQSSAFKQERAGTADQYDVDYNSQVARMMKGNGERYAKLQYYDTLENEGLAMRTQGSDRPPPEAKMREEEGYKNPQDAKERMWIRRDIFNEHRQLMNTDSPLDSSAKIAMARILNTVQLKSFTDPTFHVANIISAITGSQGGGSRMIDAARQIPGVNMADAIARVTSHLRDVAADTPEMLGALQKIPGFEKLVQSDPSTVPGTRAKLANIATIGALREGHPGVVQAIDRAGRLAMNELFDGLVKEGLIEDREDLRRDYINQVGQYNPRLMGKTKALFKELGISPFIVAGQNFNQMGLRRLAMSPGVETSGIGSMAKMVATNMAGTLVSAAVVPMAINYATSGKVAGPPGTKIGAIGWTDKDGILHQIDPLKWTNLRRGMRITGIDALVNDLKAGKDLNHAGGQAWEDIKNGAIQPWAGPAANFVSVLMTGKSPSGFQIAEKANPLDRTEAPTLGQAKNNIVAATSTIQPHAAAFLQGGRQTNPQDFDVSKAASGVFKSLGRAVGYNEGTHPVDPQAGAAQTALYNDELAKNQRTNTVRDLAAHWDTMPIADKQKAVQGWDDLQKRSLLEEVKATRLGLNQTDREIRDLGVDDGARAKFLADQILSLPPEQRTAYINDKAKKQLLTDTVKEQLIKELHARRGAQETASAK